MKARINTYAFRQTQLESESLGVLGSIAHPLPEEGEYRGTVRSGRAEVAAFRLSVDPAADALQADVDLAKLAASARRQGVSHEPCYRVKTGAWLVLFVSEGPPGYSVRLDKTEGKKRRRAGFDSRELGDGDIFIASLLRPGRYRVTDRHGKHESKVWVSYLEPGKEPFRPKPPVKVEVRSGGFEPTDIEVAPTQGIVFTVGSAKSAITLDLVEPDDGPRREDRPRRGGLRWVNPATSG